MDINCNQCGKFLFSTEETKFGAIGFQAQEKGFVYKLPVLFTDKYERLFFCNHECGKKFYDENIPKNPEITKSLEDMKKQIPAFAKEFSKNMAEIVEQMSKINNSKVFNKK